MITVLSLNNGRLSSSRNTSPLDLDIESFIAAQLTCRYWKYAASSPSIIRNILLGIPVEVPSMKELTSRQWNLYLNQVSKLNLMDWRDHIVKEQYQRKLPQKWIPPLVVSLSHDNRRLVALHGARVMVYDAQRMDLLREFSLASSLYPIWTSVSQALMKAAAAGYNTVNQRYANHHISVSSDGCLVAIGLGRTIHIYGLCGNQADLQRPAQYRLGQADTKFGFSPGPGYEEADGVVESLEFVDDNTLLRIVVGKNTALHRNARVLYLGRPEHAPTTIDLVYWRANMNRIYFDSGAMSVVLSAENQAHSECIFRGLQLFPESCLATRQGLSSTKDSGRYFATTLRTSHTSAYCIGHVAPVDSSHKTQTVKICRIFASRHVQHSHEEQVKHNTQPPSLYIPLTKNTTTNNDDDNQEPLQSTLRTIPRWSALNLPTATSPSPFLAVSNDAKLLAIYESDDRYSPTQGGSLYICTLDGCSSPPATPNSTSISISITTQPQGIVPCRPFLLDVLTVDIESLNLRVVPHSEKNPNTKRLESRTTYKVTALAGGQILEWCLN